MDKALFQTANPNNYGGKMSSHSRLSGLFFTFLLLTILLQTVAVASADKELSPFSITIDRVQIPYDSQDSIVRVPVKKTSGLDPLNGFEFNFKYDKTQLAFENVEQGDMFWVPDNLQWEYFTYRIDTANAYILVFAQAETPNGPNYHPTSFIIPDGETLFTLVFTISSPPEYVNPASIDFFWIECEDNVLTLQSTEATLGISNHVFSFYSPTSSRLFDIAYPDCDLPGRFGAPDNCILDESIIRNCDFYNGCIYFTGNSYNARGDINCDGISNQIADLVGLQNYFLFGNSTFYNHFELSRENSDVNADGRFLGLEDYLYLQRIITENEPPNDTVFSHNHRAVTFTQDMDQKTVELDYTGDLAAICLLFEGDVNPTFLLENEGYSEFDTTTSDTTRIIYAPLYWYEQPLPNPFNIDKVFLNYSGEGILLSASAADYEDNVFNVRIEHTDSSPDAPFSFQIDNVSNVKSGQQVSIPVYKTAGSEDIAGFDFLIGFDYNSLSITEITPGEIFDEQGFYQWEHFNFELDSLVCTDEVCPSALLRVTAIADLNNGTHHPSMTSIPDGALLFILEGTAVASESSGNNFVPISFFWNDCGDNAVAYGTNGDSLSLSRFVYSPEDVDITDNSFGFPGLFGSPDECFSSPTNPPLRYADFKSGGLTVWSTELIVRIDTAYGNSTDTAIVLDMFLSNPVDTIVAFTLFLQSESSDQLKFGTSPGDTNAFSLEGTLIEDWEIVSQISQSGNYSNLQITGFANSMFPYTNAIEPQEDVLFLRLLLNLSTYFNDDSTLSVALSYLPEETSFSDEEGFLIGVDNLQYDSNIVTFYNGAIIQPRILSGDSNRDSIVSIGDAIYIVNYCFRGGPEPHPLCTGDVNYDNDINIGDAIHIVNYIFKHGMSPWTYCR